MNKTIFCILITSLILSCKTDIKKTPSKENIDHLSIDTIDNIKKDVKIEQVGDLKALIRSLKIDNLDFTDLYTEIENTTYSSPLIDRKQEQWIFDLEKIDSLQFEQAHRLYPKCKLYENDNIVSVIFADLYDYKTAFHLFTFKKPKLEPISSFILYSLGGDGEDFWNIKSTKLSSLSYKVEDEFGYDNNAIKENEFLIKLRETRKYIIDSISGKLTKEIIKTEKDIKEIRK